MSAEEYDDRGHHVDELVMPFTVVASVGGPYDDEAFAAGWAAGALDAELSTRTIAATTELIRTALIPQLDLIAMRYGYRLDVLIHQPAWSHIGFTREDSDG